MSPATPTEREPLAPAGARVRSLAKKVEREPWGHHPVAGGELFLERPLPFLVMLRSNGLAAWECALVSAEPARLVVDPESEQAAEALYAGLAALRRHMPRVLLIDIVPTDVARPWGPVRVFASDLSREAVVDAWSRRDGWSGELAAIDCVESVEVVDERFAPPLIAAEELERMGVRVVQIEMPRVWRPADDSGAQFPLLLRELRASLSHAIHALCLRFAAPFLEPPVTHPGAFGIRHLGDVTRKVDAVLAGVASSFSFLLASTPINLHEAWLEFSASGQERVPNFRYRPLEMDPDALKRELYTIPIEQVDDPALAAIFREQRECLAEQLTMLEHRTTLQYLVGSVRLFGRVDDALLELARGLPWMVMNAPEDDPDDIVDCNALHHMAAEEIAHYAGDDSEAVGCRIDDTVDSLIVDRGVLLIGRHLKVSRRRARALIAHEVGTHIVTYLNACDQPLEQLRVGLPGYDELQEGMAVLGEYAVQGITPGRLRTIAGRVVAVHALLGGASFVDIYRELVDKAGLGARQAFRTTARVWRGGGLTKDLVYLRGILRILAYLDAGHPVEPLLVGKIAVSQHALVEELMARGMIRPPKHVPRHFLTEEGRARVQALRRNGTLLNIVHRTAA